MVTSMIPSVNNVFKNPNIIDMRFLSANIPYNPLINYDWSTTTTSGLRYLKDVGNTPTYNASMYFGRGAYFNGIDQQISIAAPTTGTILKRYSDFSYMLNIDSVHTGSRGKLFMPYFNNVAIERNNFGDLLLLFDNSEGRKTIDIVSSTTSDIQKHLTVTKSGDFIYLYVNSILTQTISTSTLVVGLNSTYIGGVSNYSQYSKGTIKDVYIFGRALTQDEITQSYEQPEAFYAMAQADSTCVLNMPICETSSTVRNYKTGIDYPIINYTTSVRDNAKNLQYGLQTCKFVRNSLGIIQSASNYLECNGTGYAIIPSHTDTVNIKMTVNPTSLSGNLLSGGVTKTLTGLTLNVDNDVVINDITPTGAITLASGFSGAIKTYTEELV